MAPRSFVAKDYYGIIGLPSTAGEEEIRRAYRQLALRWHPDRNPSPDAAERFKEISEAYAVLIDPVKRREYDRTRQIGARGEFRPRREDLFRDLFAHPSASTIFDELAREFERLGMRVDRRSFEQTLFGGRAVIAGGVFIITPLTPVLALMRLARAAFRASRSFAAGGRVEAPPRGVLGRVAEVARGILRGAPASPTLKPTPEIDLTLPLSLTRSEAQGGCRKRVMLNRGSVLDEMLVTVPPGTRAGTRLRLRGRGRAAPGGGHGDVYLTVEITEGR
jgi:curved DNA-binding protein CbpA